MAPSSSPGDRQHVQVSQNASTGSSDVRLIAKRMRSLTMESRLDLGFTFCRISATEFRAGRRRTAEKLLEKLQKSTAAIRSHLDLPEYVDPEFCDRLREKATRLTEEISRLEKMLRPQS